MKKLAIVAGAFALATTIAACSHTAPVSVSPNLNVYSSYGEKLPGSYLLYVGDRDLSATIKPTGMNCGFHSFPIDIREAFKMSTTRTIEQLVESVELVDNPVPAADLARTGKAGMIVVQPQDMNIRVQFIEGFWTATADADAELAASITVDTSAGRVLGTTASGDSSATGGAGTLCDGGGRVIGEATEKALEELLGQIGERFANSPRLREGLAGTR